MNVEKIRNRVLRCTPVFFEQDNTPKEKRGEIAVSPRILSLRLGIPEELVKKAYADLLSAGQIESFFISNSFGAVEMFSRETASIEKSVQKIEQKQVGSFQYINTETTFLNTRAKTDFSIR